MVNLLSPADNLRVDEALRQAKQKTSAQISVVVVSKSDSYHSYGLTYGLLVGSVVALGLWACRLGLGFPLLLCIQLSFVVLLRSALSFNHMLARFIPYRIRDHLTMKAARRSYDTLHVHASKDVPFVLLFVSLSERCVHVITNPIVHHAIPNDWDKTTEIFTQAMRKQGLADASIVAIEQMAKILAPAFPTS